MIFHIILSKIKFGTNGVNIRDNEAIIPPFCTEFRPGLNGTSHGSKIPKKLKIPKDPKNPKKS